MTLAFAIAQLRHAYQQLTAGTVKRQDEFARGLLGPVIESLEKLSSPDWIVVRREDAEKALDDAHTAGMGAAMGRDYADELLLGARKLLTLEEE